MYEELITQIKEGGYPATTGFHLSKAQVDEIESILKQRKDSIDNYFNCTILTRLDPLLN